MKKIILLSSLIGIISSCTSAQPGTAATGNNPGFEKAMLANIRQLDTASTATTLLSLANNFQRIGDAEKTKWQPYYYAAYSYTALAFLSPDRTAIDGLTDKAEALLQQAEAIDKNNSEISCLFAMINSCRIMVDPVSRFQTKGKEVQTSLAKATQENPANPRIYLLQAMMQLRTPEAFGGGAKVAKQSVDMAIVKFKDFIPENSLSPVWGSGQAKAIADKITANNQ